jgi:hypothetical protein
VADFWQPLEWVCQTAEESRHPVITANAFRDHFYVVWADSTDDYDWEILLSMNDGSGWQSPEILSGFTYSGSKNPQIGFLSNETGVGDMALVSYGEGNSDPLLTVNSRYVPVYDIKTVAKFFPVGGGPQAREREPVKFSMYVASPNPATQVVNTGFSISRGAVVKLGVYDVSGRVIKTILNGYVNAGMHKVIWDRTDDLGRRLSSGVYFVRLETDGFKKNEKVILLR